MNVALPMMMVALASGQYVRSETGAREENDFTSHCLHWEQPRIVWHQSAPGYDANDAGPNPDAEFAAISRSMESWNQVAQSCGNFVLEEGPRLPDRQVGFDTEPDATNNNVILFRKERCADKVPAGDACRQRGPGGESPIGVCGNKYDCWDELYGNMVIAITTVSFDLLTGEILDADMEFNQADFQFTTNDGPVCPVGIANETCTSTDLQNTMTHEAGHFLGLDHTDDPTSTMYQSAARGERVKRSLDPDSAQFICEVYPKGLPSRDCTLLPAVGTIGAEVSPGGCSSTGIGPSLAALVGLLSLLRVGRKGRRR